MRGKRRRVSKARSKRSFKKGSRIHKKNLAGPIMRGGGRL